ncbi:MAG: SDR family NAD(P)-dependent oxidoreductase [Bacteroidales bacterium]|jgi:short-subunit dehydrogenase|nr:SDR family NAD(P)-dependent oxidoreductase [Bacteroidales bacterium]
MNIIITGASKGIGYQAAIKLANRCGNNILAIARSEEKLLDLKNKVEAEHPSSNLDYIVFDFYKGDFEQLEKKIKRHFDQIDILINNAGFLAAKPFLEITSEDFDQSFGVNIKAAFRLSQIVVPFMKKGAHIVNVSSMGGIQGSVKFPGLSVYSASKGAVSIFTESLAAELAEKGIKVNALAFGAVDTEMLRSAFPDYKAPLSAEEMGEYLAEFACSGAKYYNGKVLPVSVSTP